VVKVGESEPRVIVTAGYPMTHIQPLQVHCDDLGRSGFLHECVVQHLSNDIREAEKATMDSPTIRHFWPLREHTLARAL
jgi:hypothetical protein